jgi:alpha/beta superfamily hydrolase
MLAWPRDSESATGTIDGPDGVLEVTVDRPADPPRGFVVVCHPHPQQGGTKDNKVVYMSARAATQAGLAAVRFNFRSVGASGGEYDGGRGEVADARAVRDWAAQASGLDSAGLAGFSFGAAVALRLAAADGAASLITIGLPAAYFEDGLPRPDCPWLALFSEEDEVIDVSASIAAVRELTPPVEVQILEGAGHFLHGRLVELRKRVDQYWQQQ